MAKSYAVAASATALLLAGCAGGARSVPDPTAKHLEHADANGFPSSTLESLKHGRRLYVGRCSGCHTLYDPAKYPPSEWPSIVEDMRVNAEIDEAQMRDITRYVVAVSAAARDTAAPRPMGPALPDPATPAIPPATPATAP
jgi:hypothetical protein